MRRSRDGYEDMKSGGASRGEAASGTRVGGVEVYIEELVLHGFGAGDRLAIGEAVGLELTRLLTEQGSVSGLSGPMEIERLNGGTFKVASGARPAGMGSGVARAVHGALDFTKRRESKNRGSAVGRGSKT